MEFGYTPNGNNQAPKRLEDVDLSRDEDGDFDDEDEEDLFQNIQQDAIQAPNPNR